MQSSVCFGLVFLLHLLSCDFYQVFLNSCRGLALIWSIVKNWTQLLNHNDWQGKNRQLSLGSTLAEFGSLIGKFQPMLRSTSTIAWFFWNCITKFSTQDPGHFVICMFVYPFFIHSLEFLTNLWFFSHSIWKTFCMPLLCMFSKPKKTPQRGNRGLPSLGALGNWCDGLEVTLSEA